jgi:hypothetical protein
MHNVAALVLSILTALAIIDRYTRVLGPVLTLWLPPRAQWLPSSLLAAASIGALELPKAVTGWDVGQDFLMMAVSIAMAAAAGAHAPPPAAAEPTKPPVYLPLLPLLLCLGASCIAVVSCAAIMPLIPEIVSVIDNAFFVMNVIDKAVDEWHQNHPDADPRFFSDYRLAYVKTETALDAARKAMQGSTALDQKSYDAAFADFKNAYADLVILLSNQGIAKDGKLMASGSYSIPLPQPKAMTYQVGR